MITDNAQEEEGATTEVVGEESILQVLGDLPSSIPAEPQWSPTLKEWTEVAELSRLLSLDARRELTAAQRATTSTMMYVVPAQRALIQEQQEHPT
jgi:hypothetical protein